ncbi:hypothetical protein CYMTET_51852 [Cymbomonas tetramitiformis]|uniref:Uncharacterized protein n=2 Tax=Cymbomonas tetramitiformis TaxID=36881 RepID=A0AAE0ES77_9CHLO|nr:hypothetical protein CYMTET_51852 [Cymbomonas tetramitiformis]
MKGGFEEVRRLILDGEEVDKRNSQGSTALHLAAANGHAGVAKLLLQYGADVNFKHTYGSTALHWAAANGHHGTVLVLINADRDKDFTLDCDIDAKNSSGYTATGGHGGGYSNVMCCPPHPPVAPGVSVGSLRRDRDLRGAMSFGTGTAYAVNPVGKWTAQPPGSLMKKWVGTGFPCFAAWSASAHVEPDRQPTPTPKAPADDVVVPEAPQRPEPVAFFSAVLANLDVADGDPHADGLDAEVPAAADRA